MENKLTPSQWAEKYRGETTPLGGRWKPERTPELCGVMDALAVHGVEKVVLMASPQTGKTEALLNVLGWRMDLDAMGRHCLLLAPSATEAEALNRVKVQPMLAGKLCDPEKLSVLAAYNHSKICMKPWCTVLADEPDRFAVQKDEGRDGLKMAEMKSFIFYRQRKVFFVGSPSGVQGGIGEEFQKTDVRFGRTGKCPVCGTEHFMTILFFDDELRQYKCPACRAHWDNEMRLKAIAEGGWYSWQGEFSLDDILADVKSRGEGGILGFRLPAVCSSLWNMDDLARWKKHLKELKKLGDALAPMTRAELYARPDGVTYDERLP